MYYHLSVGFLTSSLAWSPGRPPHITCLSCRDGFLCVYTGRATSLKNEHTSPPKVKNQSVNLSLKKKWKEILKRFRRSCPNLIQWKNLFPKNTCVPDEDQNRIGLKDQEPNHVLPHPRQTVRWVKPSPPFNGRIIELIHSEVLGIPSQHCFASSPPRTLSFGG